MKLFKNLKQWALQVNGLQFVREVYGRCRWASYDSYADEKFSLMQSNFMRWFCSLDGGNLRNFEALIEKVNTIQYKIDRDILNFLDTYCREKFCNDAETGSINELNATYERIKLLLGKRKTHLLASFIRRTGIEADIKINTVKEIVKLVNKNGSFLDRSYYPTFKNSKKCKELQKVVFNSLGSEKALINAYHSIYNGASY